MMVVAPLRMRMSGRMDGRESGREERRRVRDMTIFQILSVPFLPERGKLWQLYPSTQY